jgi:nucleoside-diphosphate-sugar epimerase
MKILFIGGTGIISTASTALAAKQGLDITLLSRGQHKSQLPPGVKTLIADVNDPALIQKLEHESFDAVVDWIAFNPADIERDLKLFRGRTRQFVHQFCQRLSETGDPLLDYRVDSAGQSALGLFAEQDWM